MYLLLVLIAGAAACSGPLSCLKSDVVKAFDRIATSDSIKLLPGLSFDRKPQTVTIDSGQTNPRDGKEFSFDEVYDRAARIFRSHSLFWNVLPGVDLTVSETENGDFSLGVTECNHQEESRTFKFGMRRMKLMMLPIMYKLGVITTLLTLLTVFALKGLTIGVLLLIMSTAGLVAKFKWIHHPGAYGGIPAGKEVHVHVHGGGHAAYHHPVSTHYDDWVREDRLAPQSQQHLPHPPVVHRVPHFESTPSPWTNYIGESSL